MNDASEHRVELRQFDLLALGGTFRVCDMSMILLGSDSAHAVLGSAFVDGAVLASGKYDFPFRGRFKLPVDWCLIGFVHETGEGSWCHGIDLTPGMSMTILPGGNSEFMLTAGTVWSVALMPVSRLRRTFAELTAWSLDLPAHRMMLFNAACNASGRKLEKRFETLREHFVDGKSGPFGRIDSLLKTHILAGMSSLREKSSQLQPGARHGRRTHYHVVRKVEDFLFSNLRQEINNRQLCNVACTSERTLRYAFQDLLGVSPNRYLSLLRLCEASRHLSMADVHRRTVKSVALSCGLWDLSRFAENYRHLFGELPNQTLSRQGASSRSVPDSLRQVSESGHSGGWSVH